MLKTCFPLTALCLAGSASAQNVLHYWDFESMTDVVGGLATTAVGVPDLSLHATYGEAYPGSNQSLNSTTGGTSVGAGHLSADVFDGAMATALDFGTANFAFSYWSYDPNDGDIRGPRPFDYLSTTTTGVQLGTDANGNWNLRIDDDLGGVMLTSGAGVVQALDTWTQVCINVDRANAQVETFFDGVSVGVFPITDVNTGVTLTGSVFPTTDLELGAMNGGTNAGQVQDAGLDDFAIYDGLLDAQGIAGLASGALTPLDFAGGIGQSYCGPAFPNSSGVAAVISATGTTTAASNDVTLIAEQLPAGQFGYFLAGQTQGFFNPPGSSGFICLSGNIGRYNAGADIIQGPMGSLQIDLTAIPVNPPQPALAGETWNFQCWYRDNNPSQTSNFTDGLTLVFQ